METDRTMILAIQDNLHRIKAIAILMKNAADFWLNEGLQNTDEVANSIYHAAKEIIDIAEKSDPDRADFRQWGNKD